MLFIAESLTVTSLCVFHDLSRKNHSIVIYFILSIKKKKTIYNYVFLYYKMNPV